MAVIYLTSDTPGAGKTALASALALSWSSSGKKTAYFKPFSSTPDDDKDTIFVSEQILGGRSSPPIAGNRGDAASVEKAAEKVRELAGISDCVLVEGPTLSGTDVDGELASSLIGDLGGGAVLVAVYRSGVTAEDIGQSPSALASSLLGVVVNSVTKYKGDYVQSQIVPALESRGIKTLGVIPEDRTLLAPTVGQIASHLAGEFAVGGPDRDDLVERVLIGGNIMDWGETYFGRHEKKAVIVRADRPDIQMAALNTSTACLVLTGGHDLNQYIQLQADSQDVPVLVLESDTLTVARAFEELSGSTGVHHIAKAQRFLELLTEHGDLESITAAVG